MRSVEFLSPTLGSIQAIKFRKREFDRLEKDLDLPVSTVEFLEILAEIYWQLSYTIKDPCFYLQGSVSINSVNLKRRKIPWLILHQPTENEGFTTSFSQTSKKKPGFTT